VLAVYMLAALVWAGTAQARADTPSRALAYTKTELTLPMDDGAALASTLFVPTGAAPAGGWPAIVMFHGLGGNRLSMNTIAENTFANQDYVVLTFDTRGHGQSGGLFSAVGTREVADYRALHAWLAARDDVRDDRIGAWGISLGGGAVFRSLYEGIPFAAAEVVETWSDLYLSLIPQNLAKSGAVFAFVNSVPVERTAPEVTAIRADAIASANLPALRTFAAERSSSTRLASIRTPVFVFQGRRDFAFGVEQGITAYRLLGGPKRLYIGAFGHAPSTFPGADAAQVFAEGSDWFARYLKNLPNGIETRPPVELAADPYRELAGAQYPGLPPTRNVVFTAKGRSTLGPSASTVRTLTRRTTTLLETFGPPTLTVSASGTYPQLVAVLKAITPSGAEITVTEGGAKTALRRTARPVTIRMISQVTTIPRGSRLVLRLGPTSGDLLYIQGVPRGSRITIGNVKLTLPVLRKPVSG
jgi:predicted acyl esterase